MLLAEPIRGLQDYFWYRLIQNTQVNIIILIGDRYRILKLRPSISIFHWQVNSTPNLNEHFFPTTFCIFDYLFCLFFFVWLLVICSLIRCHRHQPTFPAVTDCSVVGALPFFLLVARLTGHAPSQQITWAVGRWILQAIEPTQCHSTLYLSAYISAISLAFDLKLGCPQFVVVVWC